MIKRNVYGQYKVGSAALLTFMQIKPGNEGALVAKLYKDFPEAIVCKVFGNNDVCMIQRFTDWPEQPLFTEEYQEQGIYNIRNVIAFGWAGMDKLDTAQLQEYPALGICFLKANREFLSESGIRGEHQILHAIRQAVRGTGNNTKVAVLGTLGWYEAVLVINSKRISDVLDHAKMISRALVTERHGTALACFETTETIPAIICRADGRPRHADIGPRTSIEVRVSCHSWSDATVKKLLEEYLGHPSYVAGTDDFVVKDIPEKTLSGYSDKLWKFRMASADMVYKTRTTFLVKHVEKLDTDLKISVTSEERIRLPVTHHRLKLLKQNSLTIYQLLLEVYLRLNDILADPRRSSAIKDLIPFARKLMTDILEPEPDEKLDLIDDIITLGKQLELLLFGMRQRCVGMQVSDSDWACEPCFTGDSVGIHRIISALNFLPSLIMRGLHASWSGFIVAGFTETYHRYFGGPINIPVEAVYNPELWFGIYHEIGHEYNTTQIDLMNNTPLRAALGESASSFQADLILASEIYSEIFSCRFGFRGDFDSYLESTCKYLGRLPVATRRIESRLLQFLTTYIFMLEDTGDRYIGDRDDLLKLAKQVKRKMRNHVEVARIDDALLHRTCSRVLELRVVLDILRDLMPGTSYAKTEKEGYGSMVRRGAILLDVADPVHFIQQVVHDSPLSFRGATALILSLWNSAVQKPA